VWFFLAIADVIDHVVAFLANTRSEPIRSLHQAPHVRHIAQLSRGGGGGGGKVGSCRGGEGRERV